MTQPALFEVEASRYWWILATAGGLTTAAGVTIVAWPSATVRVVAFVFGLALVIHGFSELVTAASARRYRTDWGYYLTSGILSLAFGAPAIFLPQLAAKALAIFFGAFMITTGIVGITAAAVLRSKGGRGGGYFLRGFVAAGLGTAIVAWPEVTLSVVTVIAGLYLIAAGILIALAGFALGGYGSGRVRLLPSESE